MVDRVSFKPLVTRLLDYDWAFKLNRKAFMSVPVRGLRQALVCKSSADKLGGTSTQQGDRLGVIVAHGLIWGKCWRAKFAQPGISGV